MARRKQPHSGTARARFFAIQGCYCALKSQHLLRLDYGLTEGCLTDTASRDGWQCVLYASSNMRSGSKRLPVEPWTNELQIQLRLLPLENLVVGHDAHASVILLLSFQ